MGYTTKEIRQSIRFAMRYLGGTAQWSLLDGIQLTLKAK